MAAKSGGAPPPPNSAKEGGRRGRADSLSFSISASCNLFAFARRFWNHIFTCVSVSLSEEENSALSAMLRYCLSLNFFSKARSCCVVNGVRGLRFGLCLRSWQRTTGGPLGAPAEEETRIETYFWTCYHLPSLFPNYVRVGIGFRHV